MPIRLLDLLSEHPSVWWSPNTYNVRFCLHYKGLEFETQGVHYPQVKAVSQGLGLKSTGQGMDYTLPVLVDSDGTVVRDSYEIVKYLDGKYPERPVLDEHVDNWLVAIRKVGTPLAPIAKGNVPSILDADDRKYFTTTRELGPAPADSMQNAKAALQPIIDTLNRQMYLGGSEPTYADFFLASIFIWVKRGSEEKFEELVSSTALTAWWQRVHQWE